MFYHAENNANILHIPSLTVDFSKQNGVSCKVFEKAIAMQRTFAHKSISKIISLGHSTFHIASYKQLGLILSIVK